MTTRYALDSADGHAATRSACPSLRVCQGWVRVIDNPQMQGGICLPLWVTSTHARLYKAPILADGLGDLASGST